MLACLNQKDVRGFGKPSSGKLLCGKIMDGRH
jgi:hypothetical protein